VTIFDGRDGIKEEGPVLANFCTSSRSCSPELKSITSGLGRILALLGCLLAASGAFAQSDSTYSGGLFELGDGQPPPGFPGAADILGSTDQAGPDWEDFFTASGTLRDDYPLDGSGQPLGNGVPDFAELYGGRWAVFTADYVSLGSGFEGSALAGSPDLVRNGAVAAANDIGNAYVYGKRNAAGSTVLYLGVERLSDGDSYVEFELNQDLIRLGRGGFGRGVPWELVGERATNDLLVRLNFSSGTLASVGVYRRLGDSWLGIAAVSGEACDAAEALCAIGNAEAIDEGPWGNQPIATGRFAEVGVDIGGLLGSEPSLRSIQIRTPEDIAFGYFAEGN
jgi:hypothetical protein